MLEAVFGAAAEDEGGGADRGGGQEGLQDRLREHFEGDELHSSGGVAGGLVGL